MRADGTAADIQTMGAAAHPQTHSQAPSLLVEQVSRVDPGDRPTAAARLEQQLGPELTALLVTALTGDHSMRRFADLAA